MIARVLVTYAWCRTSYVAVRSLAQRGHEVFTCDSNVPAMCGWSRFVQKHERVADPFSEPGAYARDIARLARAWAIDVVLPSHEDALVLRQFEALLPTSARLACPAIEALELAVDKARVTSAAMDVGVTVPRTRFPGSPAEAHAAARELGYPVVVKVRRSNSGKGVAQVFSDAELADLLRGRFRSYCTADRFPIIQEYLSGSVVGACFIAKDGKLAAVFLERYLRCKDGAFGTSVFREPLHWALLEERVRRLVAHLRWTGIGHLDFIADTQHDNAYLLEMNPRLWGAINLSYINGYDFPAALVAQTLGELDLTKYFVRRPVPERRSLWIIGELISIVNGVRRGQASAPVRAAVRALGELRHTRFDDFVWHDPVPLLAEMICYGSMFCSSGGSTNPHREGMQQ